MTWLSSRDEGEDFRKVATTAKAAEYEYRTHQLRMAMLVGGSWNTTMLSDLLLPSSSDGLSRAVEIVGCRLPMALSDEASVAWHRAQQLKGRKRAMTWCFALATAFLFRSQ